MAVAGPVMVDGSRLEGGGQIVRISLALAALLKQPLVISKIRGKRPGGGGLRAQHLAGVRLVSRLSGGKLSDNNSESSNNGSCVDSSPKPKKDDDGLAIGSTELRFEQGVKNPADAGCALFEADAETAGSTLLLFEISLVQAMFHESGQLVRLRLRGGTNAIGAPQVDYTQVVFAPVAARMGCHFDLDVERRGFFPRGHGVLNINIKPRAEPLQPLVMLERGKVVKIHARIWADGFGSDAASEIVKAKIWRAMEKVFVAELADFSSISLSVDRSSSAAGVHPLGKECGAVIVAYTSEDCLLAGSSLGISSGEKAARMLVGELMHGGCVDEYLQDQIVILAALAEGTSTVLCGPLSLHTRTAVMVASMMSGAEFSIRRVLGRSDASMASPETGEDGHCTIGPYSCGCLLDPASEDDSIFNSGQFLLQARGIAFTT